jgi:hypothetical protein
VELTWTPEQISPANTADGAAGLSIFTALQEQLVWCVTQMRPYPGYDGRE